MILVLRWNGRDLNDGFLSSIRTIRIRNYTHFGHEIVTSLLQPDLQRVSLLSLVISCH